MIGSINVKDKTGGTSRVQVSACRNGKISATHSTIDVRDTSQFEIYGYHHPQITLESCSDATIDGSNSRVRLRTSSKVRITGDQNDVQAEDAKSLTVQGNGNRLNVKTISNHIFRPTHANKNVFEVTCNGTCLSGGDGRNNSVSIVTKDGRTVCKMSSFKGRMDLTGPFVTSWCKKFTVEYADSAKITGPLYEVGIFRFHTNMDHPACIDITVDSSSVGVQKVTPSADGHAVQLEGYGGADAATVQTLELKGPSLIEIVSPTGFRMHLPPFPQYKHNNNLLQALFI